MNFYNRVKKYLFLLASLISTILIIHIVIVYLYDGAEEVAEKGGSFSIGFVDSIPNLDPTLFGTNTRKDFVLSLLYRGLIRYNPETKSMEGDLATCDLSKNLAEIRCNLKDGGIWSDGSKITIEDILATYSLLAETDKNKRLQTGLAKFQITREGTSLVFRNSIANTENIEFLTLPIIKKSVAEQMRSGEKIIDPIYSGDYIFEKKDANISHGSESFHFIKSTSVVRPIYDRLILRFYGDEISLLNDLGSVNLIYPGSITQKPSDNRFQFISYTTPDYTSAFINANKFGLESRKVFSQIIANNFEESTKNPFGISSPSITGTGIVRDEMLEKIGYYRKNRIPGVKQSEKKPLPTPIQPVTSSGITTNSVQPVTSSGSLSGTGVTIATTQTGSNTAVVLTQNITTPKKLEFFDTPGNQEKIAILLTEEILIGGKVPKNIDSISVNGYNLKGFQSGDTRFLYRAKTSIGNLQLGKNTYEVKMFLKGKLQNSEVIEIHAVKNLSAKTALELTWKESNQSVETPAVSNSNSGTTNLVSGNVSTGTVSTGASSTGTAPTGITSTGTTSTGILNPNKIIVSGNAEVKPTPALPIIENDTKLYTASGTQATIKIHFIPSTKTIDEDVEKLKTAFESIGFKVLLTSINPDPESTLETKKINSKTYDIFVVSVNLGFTGVNLSPYFHSGQVLDGFNFSGVKNPSLDPLLEEISTKELGADQKDKVLKKASDIIRQENISVPLRLYTANVGTDILIKDFKLPEILPDSKHIKETILKSYMKTIFIVDFEKKSFSDFLNWSQSKLFNS